MTRTELEACAAAAGFRHLRITPVGPTPHAEHLSRWLAAGHDADMAWIRRGEAVRADPRARMAAARSVIVLAVDHHHQRPPDPGGLTGQVARYAWGRDYHNLVGKRLRRLRRALWDREVDSWGGVDTAPILERSWAAAAGLGYSGKNSLAIVPARGSWMLLAVLFVDVELAPDAPLGDHCGTCRRCLDACPTNAFTAERMLDSRLCISYWTIESRGPIPPALRARFGRWVFGCDVCQEVCPHNAAPPDPEEADFAPRNAWLDLEELLETPDEQLLERFRGTPIRRPGPEGLRRNAAVVLGNLSRPEAIPILRRAHDGGSELVREHAAWALERLGG